MNNRIGKIPEDMDILRKVYESKKPMEGTCGPTILALLLGKSVWDIIDSWSINYQGYTSFRELEREVNKYGIETERIRAIYKDAFVLPEGVNRAIARVQWKGKYSHWTIAEKNTHFIYFEKVGDKIHLFDNTAGWFEVDSPVSKDYLIKGKITSFIAIKEKEVNK